MMARTIKTSLVFGAAFGGADHEPDLILTYSVSPGSAPTSQDPGCDPSAELLTAHVVLPDGCKIGLPEWMFGMLYADEGLQLELLADAAERDEYARDQAADARREEMMLERGR